MKNIATVGKLIEYLKTLPPDRIKRVSVNAEVIWKTPRQMAQNLADCDPQSPMAWEEVLQP